MAKYVQLLMHPAVPRLIAWAKGESQYRKYLGGSQSRPRWFMGYVWLMGSGPLRSTITNTNGWPHPVT